MVIVLRCLPDDVRVSRKGYRGVQNVHSVLNSISSMTGESDNGKITIVSYPKEGTPLESFRFFKSKVETLFGFRNKISMVNSAIRVLGNT